MHVNLLQRLNLTLQEFGFPKNVMDAGLYQLQMMPLHETELGKCQ